MCPFYYHLLLGIGVSPVKWKKCFTVHFDENSCAIGHSHGVSRHFTLNGCWNSIIWGIEFRCSEKSSPLRRGELRARQVVWTFYELRRPKVPEGGAHHCTGLGEMHEFRNARGWDWTWGLPIVSYFDCIHMIINHFRTNKSPIAALVRLHHRVFSVTATREQAKMLDATRWDKLPEGDWLRQDPKKMKKTVECRSIAALQVGV